MKTNLRRIDAEARAELISDVHYDVALDITGAETFTSRTTVAFTSGEGEAFFDLIADRFEATLDGTRIDDRSLTLTQGTHELVVDATQTYSHTGEGLHKFVDPADGKEYLYTQFEPAYAQLVFACFDQPDLKATYDIAVTAPERYVVVLNESVDVDNRGDGTAVTSTKIDYPLSTYLIAVIAGEYESVHDEYTDSHGEIPLGLYARASIIKHMDSERLFRETKEGFGYFHKKFGRAYPFGKYDQIFCPEYNMGAMENVGAVTLRDEYVFTSPPTPFRYERRNDTILHEMAHMWFGDLVTMKWWDDLWLNESFATWSAAIAQAEATEFENAWVTFASIEKAWAYAADQLPSTHPIAADAPDIETAEQNFDGITYAKGASVLKQLAAYVGVEQFFAGVRDHFANHAFANATFADLLGALEKASGRDLSDWADQWLRTTGVSILRPDTSGGAFTVIQESPVQRTHRVGVGLYSRDEASGKVTRTHYVEVDITGAETAVPELDGVPHDLALVNDEDLTYCLMGLTDEHTQFVLDYLGDIVDPMARTLCWSAIWEAVRGGRLPARKFVELVARFAGAEDQPAVQERLLGQATSAVKYYVSPDWQREGYALLENAFRGQEPRIIFDRALAQLDQLGPDSISYLRDLLYGDSATDNQELRWLALTALTANGEFDGDAAAKAAAEEDDPSSQGEVSRLRIRAAADKRWAWDELTGVGAADISNLASRHLIEGIMWNDRGLEGLTDEFFRIAPQLWDTLSNEMAQRTLEGLYPAYDISQSAVDKAHDLLNADVPAGLKRVISEGQDRAARAVRNRAVDEAS
ncbi:aminopeptidase N [Corynebacterium aquatimens]|uniref:Aminopeptidase N n=1 Tax=Corynebacterium aquatimens TaxID=1190508 RepID=A0A931E2V1_9CORY|nr:aminopeptidase N [Corynebacterium aquatimens]MBG6122201.1 aminopeptidase N [Corynebacterium aquatimens]